jgi:hypothetical protein
MSHASACPPPPDSPRIDEHLRCGVSCAGVDATVLCDRSLLLSATQVRDIREADEVRGRGRGAARSSDTQDTDSEDDDE